MKIVTEMIDVLTEMTDAELFEAGKEIAAVARTRPDIVHRFVLGMRHEFESQGMYPMLGELLWSLNRRGTHDLKGADLPIPFMGLLEAPSGYGKLKT